MSAAPTLAPQSPSLGQASFVAWSTYHNSAALARLDRSIVGMIAKPLVHAVVETQFAPAALDAGFGVALPGEAWRNQLPPGAAKRTRAFEELPYAIPRELRVEAPMGEADVHEYAYLFIDAQLRAGATAIVTPAHVLGEENERWRELDLRLAQSSIAEFSSRQSRRPAPGRNLERRLFAAIMVQGKHLNEHSIERIVTSYAGLDVAGFWLSIVNCNQGREQVSFALQLVRELQAYSGPPASWAASVRLISQCWHPAPQQPAPATTAAWSDIPPTSHPAQRRGAVAASAYRSSTVQFSPRSASASASASSGRSSSNGTPASAVRMIARPRLMAEANALRTTSTHCRPTSIPCCAVQRPSGSSTSHGASQEPPRFGANSG